MEGKCEAERVEKGEQREMEREVDSEHVWLWHNIYCWILKNIFFFFFFAMANVTGADEAACGVVDITWRGHYRYFCLEDKSWIAPSNR